MGERPFWEKVEESPEHASGIQPVAQLPDIERRMHTGDGEKVTVYARAFIGRSEKGFHSRIDVHHEYDDSNDAGFGGNYRHFAVKIQGVRHGWSPPFDKQEDASRDAKRTLVEFDKRVARHLNHYVSLSGGESYARINRALKEGCQNVPPATEKAKATVKNRFDALFDQSSLGQPTVRKGIAKTGGPER